MSSRLGWTRRSVSLQILAAVASDRFNRATFHSFFTKPFFFRGFRLLVDVRVAAIVITFEIGGRGFAAKIAIDALLIDIEFAGCIFGIFVTDVRHDFLR